MNGTSFHSFEVGFGPAKMKGINMLLRESFHSFEVGFGLGKWNQRRKPAIRVFIPSR